MLSAEALAVICVSALEVPLLLFGISVDICVLHQILKNNQTFNTGFYKLFLWQGTGDVCHFLLLKAMQLSRLDAFIPDSLYLNPTGLRVGYGCLYYILCFQVTLHTYIAANRYTAIARPIIHANIWSGSRLRTIIMSAFILPVPCATLHWFNSVTAVTHTNPDGTQFYAPLYASPGYATVAISVALAYNVVTALVSIVLEIWTFVVYKTMSESNRKLRRNDYRLLVYAICQFAGQFLTTVYFSVILAAHTSPDSKPLLAVRLWYSLVIDVLCLTGPACLFFTSIAVKEEYLKMFALKALRATRIMGSSEN